jgi:hypothetical protein
MLGNEQLSENPYRALRMACGISTRDFAKKYELAKTTLTYIETAQYVQLSEYQRQAIGEECHAKGVPAEAILRAGWGVPTLGAAYEAHQHAARRAAHDVFNVLPPQQRTASLSPFHFYIKATTGSVQSFCKTLKVPASSVLRYTTGVTHSMPTVIHDALCEAEVAHLEELQKLQSDWRLKYHG